ncbi:hypothetical protein K438DRAFT_1954448 [Mycena galopus ATCC 62051]|nr:hypothetical protein K438DRAFT_1954448 [Mycena galopus ATCC 62051]
MINTPIIVGNIRVRLPPTQETIRPATPPPTAPVQKAPQSLPRGMFWIPAPFPVVKPATEKNGTTTPSPVRAIPPHLDRPSRINKEAQGNVAGTATINRGPTIANSAGKAERGHATSPRERVERGNTKPGIQASGIANSVKPTERGNANSAKGAERGKAASARRADTGNTNSSRRDEGGNPRPEQVSRMKPGIIRASIRREHTEPESQALGRNAPRGIYLGQETRPSQAKETTIRKVRFVEEAELRKKSQKYYGRYQSLEEEEAELFPEIGDFPQRTPIPPAEAMRPETAKKFVPSVAPRKEKSTFVRGTDVKGNQNPGSPTGLPKAEKKNQRTPTPAAVNGREEEDRRKAIDTITRVIGTRKVPTLQVKELADALAKFDKEAETPAVNRRMETAQGKEQGNKTHGPDRVFDLRTLYVETYTYRSMAELADKIRAQKGPANAWRKITRKVFRCYNCGGAGHMSRKCRKQTRRRFPTESFDIREYSEEQRSALTKKLRSGGFFMSDPGTEKKPEEEKPKKALFNSFNKYTFLTEQVENSEKEKKEEETAQTEAKNPKGLFIGCRSKKDRKNHKGFGGNTDVKEEAIKDRKETAGIQIEVKEAESTKLEERTAEAVGKIAEEAIEALPKDDGKFRLEAEVPEEVIEAELDQEQDGKAVETQSEKSEEASTPETKITSKAKKSVKEVFQDRKIKARRMYASREEAEKLIRQLATITEELSDEDREFEEAAAALAQAEAEAESLEEWKASLDSMLETEEDTVGRTPQDSIESEIAEEITGVTSEEEQSLEYQEEVIPITAVIEAVKQAGQEEIEEFTRILREQGLIQFQETGEEDDRISEEEILIEQDRSAERRWIEERIARAEQDLFGPEKEEDSDEEIPEEKTDYQVEDLEVIQNDTDNEIEETEEEEEERLAHERDAEDMRIRAEFVAAAEAKKVQEAPRRLNYIMREEEIEPVTRPKNLIKDRKQIDDLFRRLSQEDSDDEDYEETPEEEAIRIAANNARYDRCMAYRRQYCQNDDSEEEDDKIEPWVDRNSIWE